MTESKNTFNNSILKAFQLLEQFKGSKQEWGVRELAQQLNANKSTTYRIMATLVQLGVLQQDPISEKYRLGLKLFELGNRVAVQSAFANQTHRILEAVAAQITETVHLGVLQSNAVLVVDRAESPMGLQLHFDIGTYHPLHCTSMGKVLLAFQPNTEAFLAQLSLNAQSTQTITQKKQLKNELSKIRNQHFALDREELELGLICVGVPVFNQSQQLVAALSASGPANRFKEEALPAYVKILQNGARQIQERIGHFKMNA
ncbi:MAG: IclR family transcriptional regulator [Saprospiraceae bacterium]|nr:IclR family transcriptional regulator [Saprospiraceae bacterium]